MKPYPNFTAPILILFITIFFGSCLTKNITHQVTLQNLLISPQLSNQCWVLRSLQDSEVIKYYLQYYEHNYDDNFGSGFIGSHYYTYSDPVIRKTYPLTKDYFSEYKIDHNATDCNPGLDINDSNHLFFRVTDYPDFNRKKKNDYTYNTRLLHETAADATNPNLVNTTNYYYEELYFEANGNFRKKIFLDNTCNFINITGKWRFGSPFAKKEYEVYETEIILDYDNANRVGITPRDNVYILRQDTENPNVISFSKEYKESDSSFLATRGHYSIITDNINYIPDYKNPAGRYVHFGKIISYSNRVCSDIGGQADDRIIIDDPLTLIKSKEYSSNSSYYKTEKRKCNDSTQNDTPITGIDEKKTVIEAYLGMGVSTKTGKYPGYQFVPGGQMGLEAQVMNLTNEISLGVGAAYSMQGGKYKSTDYIPGGNYGTSSNTSRLNYINFPVTAHYQKASTGFFAEAGIQPGILISAKDKGTSTTDIKDEITKFDVGIPVGAGYKFENNFGIGVRVTPGLINVNKDKHYKNNNLGVSLRATYALKPARKKNK